MSDKKVARIRTRARDAQTSHMCWGPVGPVGTAPLVGPVRAVLARPCGPRVALGALRYSRHGPFRRVGTGLSVSIVQIVLRNRDCFEITEISRAFLWESPAGRRSRARCSDASCSDARFSDMCRSWQPRHAHRASRLTLHSSRIPSICGPRPVSRPPTMSEVGGVRLPMGPAFGPVSRRSTSVEKVRMSDLPHA